MKKFKVHSLSLKACKNPRESLSPSGVDVSRNDIGSLY